MQASVLIATYNQPEFLRRTLLGMARQTTDAYEIVICDDGSGPEIGAVLDEWRGTYKTELRRVTQEDRGFRKCRILNAGIRESRTDYLIFLDADCIPHRGFVEAHLRCRREGAYLVGRRVQLSARYTDRLTDRAVLAGCVQNVWLAGLPDAFTGKLRHLEAAVRTPHWWWRLAGARPLALKGCNFSCWKSDMQAINGFDEEFVTPSAGEDTDVERRFLLLGLQSVSVKHRALCYHQYHPLLPRGTEGLARYERLKENREVRCEHGLR